MKTAARKLCVLVASLGLLAVASPVQAQAEYPCNPNDSALLQQIAYNMKQYPVMVTATSFALPELKGLQQDGDGISVIAPVYRITQTRRVMRTRAHVQLWFRCFNGIIEAKPSAGYLQGIENGQEYSVPLPFGAQ